MGDTGFWSIMNKGANILVLGSNGMVGSALIRALNAQGFSQVLKPLRDELDLANQSATLNYFETHKPEFVFMAAAKVGGILANNTYRADFIHQNLLIQKLNEALSSFIILVLKL